LRDDFCPDLREVLPHFLVLSQFLSHLSLIYIMKVHKREKAVKQQT